MGAALATDVHQHLWPDELVDRLRARRRPPYLDGWRLHTRGQAPYDVDPAHHDVARRIEADQEDGVGLACVSLSAPLGIENLVRPEAGALIAAWHEGARALPGHFAAWASVPMVDPDLDELDALLRDRFVGLQVPATDLLSPAAWERAGAVLGVAEEAGKPVFVHPGPEVVPSLTGTVPEWWAPVVGYVTQMQAAWWGWHAARGRALFPTLRVLFGAGAGLAPVHHERHSARGGETPKIDPRVYVDTSSYGPQALDALVRVLGIDVLALGSDRPYAQPLDRLLGDAATHAIRVANPQRLLHDYRIDQVEAKTWPRAS
jgi:predicted TIM-barrel fold metal-dependent hydrolase